MREGVGEREDLKRREREGGDGSKAVESLREEGKEKKRKEKE